MVLIEFLAQYIVPSVKRRLNWHFVEFYSCESLKSTKECIGRIDMLSVTPTKLSDYLICPHKYKLKHINKIENATASAALSFGRTMHRALESLHQSEKELKDFTEVSELLTRYWEVGAYSNAEEDERYFAKGCRALQSYCENFDSRDETTVGTEVYLSYVLKIGELQVRLGCKADRLSARAEEVLEVIDYKTNGSGKVPTLNSLQNDLPTFLYYVLARASYPQYKQICITFLNVLTLEKVSVKYDAAQVAANKQSLLECFKSLTAANFSPVLSEACAWCSFQDDCFAFNKIVDLDSLI